MEHSNNQDNNHITVFNYGAHTVRVCGTYYLPLIGVADVCSVLQVDVTTALGLLDPDGTTLLSDPNSFIDEGEIFELIEQLVTDSRAPEYLAYKAFHKWVRSTVIPALRRRHDSAGAAEFIRAFFGALPPDIMSALHDDPDGPIATQLLGAARALERCTLEGANIVNCYGAAE